MSYVYDFKAPARLIVGLAGESIGRGGTAATRTLPGVQPCASDQQLEILGASTVSETHLSRQCLGMGARAKVTGGGIDVPLVSPVKLDVRTPVYRW